MQSDSTAVSVSSPVPSDAEIASQFDALLLPHRLKQFLKSRSAVRCV